MLIISVAAMVSIAFAFWGWSKKQEADEQKAIAVKEKMRSDDLLKEAKKAIAKFEEEERKRKKIEIDALIQKANSFLSLGETKLAKTAIQDALKIDSTNVQLKDLYNHLK